MTFNDYVGYRNIPVNEALMREFHSLLEVYNLAWGVNTQNEAQEVKPKFLSVAFLVAFVMPVRDKVLYHEPYSTLMPTLQLLYYLEYA